MKIFLAVSAIFIHFTVNAQTNWNSWVKYQGNPVYSHNTGGAWDVASDPAIIKTTHYLLAVSGDGGFAAGSPDGNVIILAYSTDIYTWNAVATLPNGVAITGNPGDWDESMEMPELMLNDSVYQIFYCGYDPNYTDSTGGLAWGDLGLAESTDGVNFTRLVSPVLTRTPGWFDQDGITDPTIVNSGDTLYMIYVGWCTQGCTLNNGFPAFYALKAMSTDFGHSWQKLGRLDSASFIGLQHPELVLNPDGDYSLFYGVDAACAGTNVGLMHATGPSPFGPFVPASASPVMCMGTQAFENNGTDGPFPTVLNDNGVGRMWYTGVDETNFIFKIGLAESFPLSVPEANAALPSLYVFPNPSADNPIVNFGQAATPELVGAYNHLGQLVYTEMMNSGEMLRISHLPAGVYSIRLLSAQSAVVKYVKTEK